MNDWQKQVTAEQHNVVEQLLARGNERMSEARRQVSFETGNEESERLLNDLEGHPRFFLLACLMDRQIPAPHAWIIPYKTGAEANGFEFRHFECLSEER